MNPIIINLSGLKQQFGIDDSAVDQLTEVCVNAVTTSIYANWQAIAKQKLHSTLPEYLENIIRVDEGRFNKSLVLTGKLPNMLEQGASPFDIKEGFRKSSKVHYTIPKYNKKGKEISKGGDWYLTIPFRFGVSGVLNQAGFTNEMPNEIYQIMKKKSNLSLQVSEIPKPYDSLGNREAIPQSNNNPYYAEYIHKNSIYEGIIKKKAEYKKRSQNTYFSFRRVSGNSDPLSWIHKGFSAYNLAEKAVQKTDVDTIVENEVMTFLKSIKNQIAKLFKK